MPPPLSPNNVYAADQTLSAVAATARPLVYVPNSVDSTVSVIDQQTLTVIGTYPVGPEPQHVVPSYAANQSPSGVIPGGGTPDMGDINADGTVFWVSGRGNGVGYAISTVDGHLIKKIAVGRGPHGLSVWPQPGRYSLGHTLLS